MVYGVARISTKKQNIERQIRNISLAFPSAKIIKETYTGTKLQGRKEFKNLLKILKEHDTLVFDSISRMSRNSVEGCNLYEKLFNKNINLVFLKEPHINTEVFKKSLENQIKIRLETGSKPTDEFVNTLFDALNKYTIALAKEQIQIAFNQSEKEVKDLQQRTKEGILTAKLNGKQIGQIKGNTFITAKSISAKKTILKHSKFFNGTLSDSECIKLIGITRNSYYKYKKELLELNS